MLSDNGQPHLSSSDTLKSSLRLGMMLAEIWRDWFETMSQVAQQTHRACEYFVQDGGTSNGQYGRFDPRPSHSPSEGLSGSIDMDKLKQCLQSMDPMQAAQIVHAVQTMQAMEATLKRQGSRANEEQGAAW